MSETRVPPVSLWDESLVSSRLLEYELRVRLNAKEPDLPLAAAQPHAERVLFSVEQVPLQFPAA